MVRANNGRHTPLERFPWIKRALIKELALGTATHTALAEKFGVHKDSITAFRKRHAYDIAEAINDAEDEFTGILVAQKAVRLSVYQDQIEQALEHGNGTLVARLLRQVAEEMGHLPSRVQVSGSVGFQTSYVITAEDGTPIDLSQLK